MKLKAEKEAERKRKLEKGEEVPESESSEDSDVSLNYVKSFDIR